MITTYSLSHQIKQSNEGGSLGKKSNTENCEPGFQQGMLHMMVCLRDKYCSACAISHEALHDF